MWVSRDKVQIFSSKEAGRGIIINTFEVKKVDKSHSQLQHLTHLQGGIKSIQGKRSEITCQKAKGHGTKQVKCT